MWGWGRFPGESPKQSQERWPQWAPKCKKGKVDNAIFWINLHSLDSATDFPKTCLLDSYLSSHYPKFKQPGLEHKTSGPSQEDIKQWKILNLLTQKVGVVTYKGHKTGTSFVLDRCLLTRGACTWRFNCINLLININYSFILWMCC